MDDPTDVGQADAGALELVGGVQALKHAKQLVHVLHVEADTVVEHGEHGLARLLLAADADVCLAAETGVLDRVGDEITQNQTEHGRVPCHLGE